MLTSHKVKKLHSPTSPLDSIPSIAGMRTALDVLQFNRKLDAFFTSSEPITQDLKDFLKVALMAHAYRLIRLEFYEESEIQEALKKPVGEPRLEDLEAYFEPAKVIDTAERVQDLLDLDSIRIK